MGNNYILSWLFDGRIMLFYYLFLRVEYLHIENMIYYCCFDARKLNFVLVSFIVCPLNTIHVLKNSNKLRGVNN